MRAGRGLSYRITRQSDLVVALGVIGILFVMLVPMPARLLDILLSLNICLLYTSPSPRD